MSVNCQIIKVNKGLLNLRPLVIYVVLDGEEMSYIGDELRRMNNYVDFTRNLFKIEPIFRKGNEQEGEDDRRLAYAIKCNNLWVRMIDTDELSSNYFFGYITTHPSYIREELYKTVTTYCQLNIINIESRLNYADAETNSELIPKLQMLKRCLEKAKDTKRTPGLKGWKSSLKKWEEFQEEKTIVVKEDCCRKNSIFCLESALDSFGDGIPLFNSEPGYSLKGDSIAPKIHRASPRLTKAKREISRLDKMEQQMLWNFMRDLCGDFPDERASKASIEKYINPKPSKSPRKADSDVSIEIKKIVSKKTRYGVEIKVGENTHQIYMGTTNDRFAYLAVLLRHKTGNYLFSHEFYTPGSFSAKRKFTKKTSYNWLQALYRIIEPSQRVDFSDWIAKFEKDRGRAMHQAISNVRRLLSETLGEESMNGIPYVTPNTVRDANDDSYYKVTINRDNIIVAKELRDLVDNFDLYYI